jgi:putative ABC transport system permease protein
MRFYQFVLKNVFRRRVRSALTMTGMAMAVGTVVALVGISDGFKKSFVELYQNRGVDLIVSLRGLSQFNGVMPEAIYRDIAALPEVAGVAPGLLETVDPKEGVYFKLLQGWPLDSFMYKKTKIIDGEVLSEKHRNKHAIMLGKTIAEAFKMKAGDTFSIEAVDDFQVVGVFDSFNPMENEGMVVLLEDMQRLYPAKKGSITGCTLILKASPDNDQVRELVRHKIENEIAAKYHMKGKIQATPAQELAQSAMQLKAATAMAWITSSIAIIIGAVFMLNTMVMSVFERTREIGILRAIGWRPWRVMRMILMESLLLSLTGGVVGTIAAIALTWFLSGLPAVGGLVRGDISITVISEGFAIALLVGLIGAAYPAYRGARLMPTEAIRHE